jgi:hypothetical protein
LDIVFDYNNLVARSKAHEDEKKREGVWGDATGNAFAHAYLSAMLTMQRGGELAADLVGAGREDWESTIPYYFGRGKDERADTYKDLHNNQVGREIGAYVAGLGLKTAEERERAVIALIDAEIARAGNPKDDDDPLNTGALIIRVTDIPGRAVRDKRIPPLEDGGFWSGFGALQYGNKAFNGWPGDFEPDKPGRLWTPPQRSDLSTGQPIAYDYRPFGGQAGAVRGIVNRTIADGRAKTVDDVLNDPGMRASIIRLFPQTKAARHH